jgi:uncharacterized protein with HEPN domain
MQRDLAVLLDIVQAAHLVLAFKEGMTKIAFDADLKTQSAVLHQFIVIGEAVKRLSPEFRASHMDIPWSAIAGMRDHLIHGYDIVDLEEVWKTATVDVPSLLTLLEPLVPPQE